MSEILESVLLATARPIDAAAVARALGPLTGKATPDARREARYCGGIALDAVPAALAVAAVEALSREGVGARRVPADAVLPLERPLVPSRAIADAAGVRLTLPAGEVAVAFADVALVLLHAMDRDPSGKRERERRREREDQRKPRGVGGEGPLRRIDRDPEALLAGEDAGLSEPVKRLIGAISRRRKELREEASLAIDLALPGGRVYRLRREDLDEIRAPGLDAAPPHSLEKLLALARAIIAGAPPTATRAPENAAILEAGILEAAFFGSGDELARYERWLRAPPAEPTAPPPPGTAPAA